MKWESAPKKNSLPANSVQLWKVQLPLGESAEKLLPTLLNPAETARAERFHFPKDRYRFSQFRGLLRFLLGQYLQMSPEKIILEENPQGKPLLAPHREKAPLYFNVTHSRDVALFAFTTVGELGVDVEKVKDPYDGEKLAERYFSSQEAAYLNSLPEAEKTRGFFRLWTLKEAYLKAMGLGFSGGLDTFSVQMEAGTGTAFLKGRHPEDPRGRWLLSTFDVGEGFVGALAAPSEIQTIQYFDGNFLEINGARDRT